jgi:hypothetical protein
MRHRPLTWLSVPVACAVIASLLPTAEGQPNPDGEPAGGSAPAASSQPSSQPSAAPSSQPSAAPSSQPSGEGDSHAQACLASFKAAQHLRKLKPSPKLLAARDELVACSLATCPEAIVVRCQQWLEEVNAAIPTLVITARSKGADVADVEVSVDGVVRLDSLSGAPIELDPGLRKIVARRGHIERKRTVLMVQGRKHRAIEFDFTPRPKPKPQPVPVPPPPPGFTMPLLGWIGFGMGIAGVVVGSITGGIALSKGNELVDQCEGGQCNPSNKDDYDAGLAVAHISTVTFAIGGAGIALGVIGLLVSGDDEEDDQPRVPPVGLGGTF